MFGSDMRLFKVEESLVEPYAASVEQSVVEALYSPETDSDATAVALVAQGALLAMHLSRTGMPVENERERKSLPKIAWKSLGSQASRRASLVLSIALGLDKIREYSDDAAAGDDWPQRHAEDFIQAIVDRWPLTDAERDLFDGSVELSTPHFRWYMTLVATQMILGNRNPAEIRPDPQAWSLGFGQTDTAAGYERRTRNEALWSGAAEDWIMVGLRHVAFLADEQEA